MRSTRRSISKEIATVSVLAGIPSIGLAKGLFEDQGNYLAVLQIGGLNAKQSGPPSSNDVLLLSEHYQKKQDFKSMRREDFSAELIKLRVDQKSSPSNRSSKEYSATNKVSEINPLIINQAVFQCLQGVFPS